MSQRRSGHSICRVAHELPNQRTGTMTILLQQEPARPESAHARRILRLDSALPLSWKAPLDANAPALGQLGSLETRLARSKAEIRTAQALRYEVFYREGSAQPSTSARLRGRDADRWDRACDHLLVIDRECAQQGGIVGTYRFLTGSNAERAGIDFYTQSEFDIAPLVARHKDLHFMELGRSCVLPQWRTKRTVELLWQGCWAYVLHNKVDVMIGCASFEGTDPQKLAEALSFLYHHAAPDEDWRVRARTGRAVSMNLMPSNEINPKRALHALPPLIKGYLRLGAWFAGEAVIDRQFATTDVLVILPVSRLNPRYVNYYGADAGRRAVTA